MTLALLAFLVLTRVVPFTGGQAVIETKGDVEHVVIKDAKGVVSSDSYCDAQSGHYDQIVALGLQIVAAVTSGDRRALAGVLEYPLRVNVSYGTGTPRVKHIKVGSKAELLAHYRTYFTPYLTDRLRQLDTHGVFCRDGMSMLDGGVIWFEVDRDGVLKVAVINE